MGMGAFGAILSVVISLSVMKPPGVRYSLSAVQSLLKIAFGALTAVLGIMVLSTLLSSDSTVLNSQLKLLVAAAVFGYSQQLFTSVLDRKGTNLQDAAVGK
jgi:TRAP-type C4-dicarboxylate transport system permease small subunit